ncbi:MAG: hypothetical protein KGZ58_09625 [Ignavibacteriales bacterium]|nr:hypothetical protein [Ignavibacteriales bacterium]
MSTETLYKEISLLPNEEKIVLVSKVMAELSSSFTKEKKLNIYDIKGVGKEIWHGIDAQEYVDKERATWER